VPALAEQVVTHHEAVNWDALAKQIATHKQQYRDEWYGHDSAGRVNPARFFDYLRADLEDDAFIVLDDGNHTFLAAELMPIHRVGGLISPTDFNCMGYAVPASIGAKLANPDTMVVSVVGDGAFMMTCMELATAVQNHLGLVQFVFNDGELSQIAQAQQRPYNRTTCTNVAKLDYQALSQALGCEYVVIRSDDEIQDAVIRALSLARENKTVVVNVLVDYSKPTRFTEGVVKTNIKRLPVNTKVRMVGRALYRKVSKPD
jgi:acetolactate synthase-1/2/3 large subunit